MVFKIRFTVVAENEFKKLEKPIREFFIEKLRQRSEYPFAPKDALGKELAGLYKIKSNKVGLRLVYDVVDDSIVVIAVGKRADELVYRTASIRRKKQ